MFVCICAAVTEQQVQATIFSGARSVEEVGERCGAGTGCGNCVEHLEYLLTETGPHAETADQLPRIA